MQIRRVENNNKSLFKLSDQQKSLLAAVNKTLDIFDSIWLICSTVEKV